MKISRCVLPGIRSLSDKSCTENQNTHFKLINFLRNSCRLRDNKEKYGGAGEDSHGNTIWCMRFARWVPKATHTHTHAFRICNTYRFSTATVTFYLHCLSSCSVKSNAFKTFEERVWKRRLHFSSSATFTSINIQRDLPFFRQEITYLSM